MLTITGVFLFTCVDAFIKLLSPSFQVGQVLIVFGLGTAVMFWAMALLSEQSVFDKRYIHKATLFRCISETIGGLALVFALANSALSVVTAIIQTSPLVLTIMAVVFLKERIGPPRIITIFVGFIGVLIVIRPTLEGVDIFAVSAVVGVIGLAERDFSADFADDISVIGLSFFGSLSVALAGVLLMVFSEGWVLPNIMQMMYCVGMIISGGLGLWCMSSSIRLADVSALVLFAMRASFLV